MKKDIHRIFLQLTTLFVFVVMLFPTFLFAHIDPKDGSTVYTTTVEITGASLVDDNNITGPAKILFDYFVTPTSPVHTVSSGITKNPITMESSSMVTFKPIEIYSHEQCGCQQDFSTAIYLQDYSPAWTALGGIAQGAINTGIGFALGGVIGAGSHIVGELVETIIDGVSEMNLTDAEKAKRDRAELERQSDIVGVMEDDQNTPCDPSPQDFTAPVVQDGENNGTLSYRITKINTERACVAEPVVDQSSGDEGDDSDDEEKPWCDNSTGKVLVKDKYICPTSTTAVGSMCACIDGYEWAYENDHCQGCQKTNKDKCMAAVKEIIDANTGNMSPRLSFSGEDKILWQEGPISCKQQSAVLNDWARSLADDTPKYRKECTKLDFVRGDPTDECGLEFLWRYK